MKDPDVIADRGPFGDGDGVYGDAALCTEFFVFPRAKLAAPSIQVIAASYAAQRLETRAGFTFDRVSRRMGYFSFGAFMIFQRVVLAVLAAGLTGGASLCQTSDQAAGQSFPWN